ncbi:MAG: type II toxin-antitoxin system ParD family antitoxin [Bryobacteraceae bacterium]
MNISITDHLVGYVRKKVRTGRYNSASEVVRDALRRMEDEEAREVRLARPSAEDIVADLEDPMVTAFLGFLEKDLKGHPGRRAQLSKTSVERAVRLTKRVKVRDDEALPGNVTF